jgi:hypothetical protein
MMATIVKLAQHCYAKCRIARDLVHIDVRLLHRQFKRSPSLQKKKRPRKSRPFV